MTHPILTDDPSTIRFSAVDKATNPFIQHDPEPIPDLPTDIEVHTKHVVSDDVVRYIKPLYTRLWGISANNLTYDRGGEKLSRMLPQLSKGFSFVHNEMALQFISDIMKIAREENAGSVSHCAI
jgi:hypothetical protein